MIESYSAGHSDLMTKVKSVQSRLDVILGKPGSKVKLKNKPRLDSSATKPQIQTRLEALKLVCFKRGIAIFTSGLDF